MKVNKDVIRQIILDYEQFYSEGRPWMCNFEDIVEEFLETQELNYQTDREE